MAKIEQVEVDENAQVRHAREAEEPLPCSLCLVLEKFLVTTAHVIKPNFSTY